ncbi:efflux transporter outer membrane subunit [Stenotrophomonas sp. YIM B06876]|uniref:efflux transporter outer membrane subunit n=1 Tax=Stenotrophomonas sp. YIM B06876 TaxID=3060211 RepID=UPI002739166E|nr:efflux transporter outer membrane subunit [Stenotrophomonas sp. YIM B06876]
MSKSATGALALAVGLFVSGCAVLEPRDVEVAPAVAVQWPIPASAGASSGAAAETGWRDFFTDPRLQEVIALALQNNRDLRVAMLNVDKARAQYGIQRAERLPALAANGQLLRSGGDMPVGTQYSADLGVAGFELDLFGRVRNLSEAALQQYFVSAEARRAAQLSLVAGVAQSWLGLAADGERLRIAQATFDSHATSLQLIEQRERLGAASALELNQAQTQLEAARADVARYRGQLAQDRNALNLLAGQTVAADLLPETFVAQVGGLEPLPAGVPAEVLLRRPDVMAAEHRLLAGNANIGAARAAFFPSIRLTGAVGSASAELSGLFESGTRIWSFMPQISLPIFQGGRLRANLGVANADRDIALAEYEKAIQSGFRDVADALALEQALGEQQAAQQALLQAAQRAHELAQARYDAGLDGFLVLLDAQRTLYGAQQGLVATQLAGQANRVSLYKALGGGWRERT